MPKGQTSPKSELSFSKPKTSSILAELKTMKASAEDKKIIREALKNKAKVETKNVSVRLKLNNKEGIQFDKYAEMAIAEGKATNKAKTAKGEIATFALLKFLKSDSFFQKKLKEMEEKAKIKK